ncbi:MAG: ABC transporter substrate-binding protein [Candidatus Bipolaricaulota bacterium]|nr:ABC transporter substrate-binding protein [Candidatus Bipolaricaulota bacterium]MDW8126638.1 ABC transporter substrate-binding protein [Candidatus Bipolaricaulota bacterium]
MYRLVLALWLLGLTAWAGAFHIVLDFYPNPNHIPLYVARELGFFREEGVEVEFIVPTDPSAPAKLVAAKVAEMGLTPQMNFFLAREEGLPLVSVGALIDGALGGLLSLREFGIETLPDLRGKRIGYSLEPLEPLLWRTMLAQAGLSPQEYALVYTGMSTVPALLSGAVQAIGAFRNYEPIAVELLGFTPVFFAQEDYGVPNTYELLFVVHPDTLTQRLPEVQGALRAIARGIEYTRAHPEESFSLFVGVFPELADELNRRSFAATLPLYAVSTRHDDPARWETMQTFLIAAGMVKKAYPLRDLYTTIALP